MTIAAAASLDFVSLLLINSLRARKLIAIYDKSKRLFICQPSGVCGSSTSNQTPPLFSSTND
jgi:hypothetical protein